MAKTYIEYTSGLTGTTFSVPFTYISIDDVQALGFDGEKYVSLTISSRSGSAKTITLSTAPSAYEKLRLYRATSNTQLVDFQNGSRLSERDLDTAYQQGLFAAQEISEDASTAQFAAISGATLQVGTSLSNFASEEFTGDGTSTVFDITAFNTQTTVNEAYRVSIDGVMQSPIDAYSISMNPSKITFASAPPSGSKIVVVTAASAASATSVDNVTIGLTSTNKAEIKDDAVTTAKIKDDAVTTAKIDDDAVTTAKIDDDAVTTAKIDDGAVTKAKIENVANMKVLGNTSGSVTAPQEVSVLDEDDMSSDSATSLATQQSIKAYVDDLIDYSALPAQSGGVATEGEQGSYTLPGGLIIKYGTLDSTASTTSYTFTTAFPTAIIGVNATVNENIGSPAETCSVHAISKAEFVLAGYRNDSGASVGRVFWTAYGY